MKLVKNGRFSVDEDLKGVRHRKGATCAFLRFFRYFRPPFLAIFPPISRWGGISETPLHMGLLEGGGYYPYINRVFIPNLINYPLF